MAGGGKGPLTFTHYDVGIPLLISCDEGACEVIENSESVTLAPRCHRRRISPPKVRDGNRNQSRAAIRHVFPIPPVLLLFEQR